jgi:hypothetical protein
MRPAPAAWANQAELNRERYDAHTHRLQQQALERRREIEALKAAAMSAHASAASWKTDRERG